MESNKPSIAKQITGAVVGSAVALALYYSYEFAAPTVTAWVTLPSGERQHDLGDARVADTDATQTEILRIQSRNREVAERMEGADPADYKLEQNTWDTNWPAANTQQASSATSAQSSAPAAVRQDDGWQDFIRDPAPVVQEVHQAAPAQVTVRSAAPTLPDSGFGAIAAAVAAVGATASRFTPLMRRKPGK